MSSVKSDCEVLSNGKILFNGSLYSLWDNTSSSFCSNQHHDSDSVGAASARFWVYLGVYICLVLFAGVASGLTLGLLSLDCTTVTIIAEGSDSEVERRRAKSLLPVIKKHHLLLVTLLLSNAIAVESMPIFLDKISNPLTSILVSVTAVLFFGEVIPQSVCSRYGTAIGYYSIPLVYLLMGLTFIVSYPVSKLLDRLLGSEHGTYYKRSELGALVDILSDKNDSHNPEPLSGKERLIIKGALKMREKTIKDINYTPLDEVYMVDYNSALTLNLAAQIKRQGWSRVPVYINKRSNIVGVIAVKHLIGYDLAEEVSISKIFRLFGRPIVNVSEDDPVYEAMNALEKTGNRIAVVFRSGFSPSKVESAIKQLGIVSLHDILEEIFQTEFFDIDNRNFQVPINFNKAVPNLDCQTPFPDSSILEICTSESSNNDLISMETTTDSLEYDGLQREPLTLNGHSNSHNPGSGNFFSNLFRPKAKSKQNGGVIDHQLPRAKPPTVSNAIADDVITRNHRETFMDDDTDHLVIL